MKKKAPTPQQLRVFEEIKRYWFAHGSPPSTPELAHTLGTSRQNIHHHVLNLKKQGLISDSESSERAFIPARERSAPTMDPYSLRRTAFQVRFIPLIGQVAAGVPILAQEQIEGGLWIESSNLNDTLFALRVRGDSMIKAGIFDNDIVIIRQQFTASDGDIVLALIDRDEATIKRLKRKGDQIGLFPENDNMKPFWYNSDRVALQGIVVESRRYYSVYADPIA
jgi:repressor LexA